MGLDFDVIEFCKNLKGDHPPPYKCPIGKCGKQYKSICGIQYHLVNYDHDTNMPIAPFITPKKKGRSRVGTTPRTQIITNSPPKDALTYSEAQKIVQFDIDGKSIRVSLFDEIPVVSVEDYQDMLDRNECPFIADMPIEQHIKLPEASYKELTEYNICDAPPRPNAYIRFIEKSVEELDGEVEYDVDEEDTTWLAIINEKRQTQGINPVAIDSLELLMDRLEKESYFQAVANGQSGAVVDDDAVCCICMDGECQNTNVILFCDMCNLAVHQDCYGVPYIPEGQWLCRRCLQSPSRPVDCVLCPNTGGAFKQTDRNQWAHVVCALWIPEVRFANNVFLEPIDSIETIPVARWKLTCYICKQKNVGACIQCHRNTCYAAFHVTCAQQAGLHMRMDTVRDTATTNENQTIIVQKTAYCDAHTPISALMENSGSGADSEKAREESRNKMKQARKMLAKKRTTVPVIMIPTIPADRIQEISQLVNIQKKSLFIQRLIAYWTLKRQYRNGVPLLRRLQSLGSGGGSGLGRSGGGSGIEGSPDHRELLQQRKYWQCLRQDLERARLLCELVRKREKLKAALIKTTEQCVMMQINPIESAMIKLLETLESKDTSEIFTEPVDIIEVPDYMDIVKNPMDLSTMRIKIKSGLYMSLDEMEKDFDLMIRNCLAYNNKDTVFYRAGIRMRDQGGSLFKIARKEFEKEGLLFAEQQQHQQKTEDNLQQTIDTELKAISNIQPLTNDVVIKLQSLHERALSLKYGVSRAKRLKQIRMELAKVKKNLTINLKNNGLNVNNSINITNSNNLSNSIDSALSSFKNITDTSSQSDGENQDIKLASSCNRLNNKFDQTLNNIIDSNHAIMLPTNQTPPCSPIKNNLSNNNSASPSGVNRRTAVLFTRKAQAALVKKPDILNIKEDSSCDASTASIIHTNNNVNCNMNDEHNNINDLPCVTNDNAITQKIMGNSTANNIIVNSNTNNYNNNNTSTNIGLLTTISHMNSNNNNNNNTNSNNNNISQDIKIKTPKKMGRSKRNSNRKSIDNDIITSTGVAGSSNCGNLIGNLSDKNKTSDSRQIIHHYNNNNSNSNNNISINSKKHSSGLLKQDINNYDQSGTSTSSHGINNLLESDSFRFYRGVNDSDGSLMSCTDSTCSSCIVSDDSSGSGSEMSSSFHDGPSIGDEDDSEDDDDDNENDSDNNNDDDDEEDSDDDDDDDENNESDSSSSDDHNQNDDKKNKKTNNNSNSKLLMDKTKQRSNNNNNNNSINETKSKKALTNNNNSNKKNKNNFLSSSSGSGGGGGGGGISSGSNCSNPIKKLKKNTNSDNNINKIKVSNKIDKHTILMPLQLVWAKCRGYPWYPALIIDPNISKNFVYNGVPLPAPPTDVLALRKNNTEPVYLVLFFDVKRTWQWLPPNKLELLGLNKQIDQNKLIESRKPSDRKAVKKAYQDALHYQNQVAKNELHNNNKKFNLNCNNNYNGSNNNNNNTTNTNNNNGNLSNRRQSTIQQQTNSTLLTTVQSGIGVLNSITSVAAAATTITTPPTNDAKLSISSSLTQPITITTDF